MICDEGGQILDLNEHLYDECGCRLDGRIFLYVGKAVKLRNRMMSYSEACRRFDCRTPPWVKRYLEPPHSHAITAAVWYEPKPMISSAEETLISVLKPAFNAHCVEGFGGLWKVRRPDLFVDLQEVAPHLKRSEVDTWVESCPGVYAWFIDPGAFIAHGHLFDSGIFGPDGPDFGPYDVEKRERSILQCQVVKTSFSERELNRVFGEEDFANQRLSMLDVSWP